MQFETCAENCEETATSDALARRREPSEKRILRVARQSLLHALMAMGNRRRRRRRPLTAPLSQLRQETLSWPRACTIVSRCRGIGVPATFAAALNRFPRRATSYRYAVSRSSIFRRDPLGVPRLRMPRTPDKRARLYPSGSFLYPSILFSASGAYCNRACSTSREPRARWNSASRPRQIVFRDRGPTSTGDITRNSSLNLENAPSAAK